MTEHTPGPWEFHEGSDNSPDEIQIGEPILGSIVGDEWHISRIWRDVPQALANAHLIAAAPDLLEALEAMREYAIPGMNWTDEIGQALLAITDKAIAKAKGQPQ